MMTLAGQLVLAAKSLRRSLQLSPMQFVLRRLRRYGIQPEQLRALESFGGTGVNQTPDLYAVVAELDIWDINPDRRAMLQAKFPKARLTTTDSYLEIQRIAKTYDLVVVDAGEKMGERYEHFEMFPHVFKALNDPGVLIVNETPLTKDTDPDRLRQRREFYGVADANSISFAQVEAAHRRWAGQNGWQIEHVFYERRWVFSLGDDPMYYNVMLLRRQSAG